MNYNLQAPTYILFCTIANYDWDRIEEEMEGFISENIDKENGIDEIYILNTLEDVLQENEFVGVEVKDYVRQKCLGWVLEKKQQYNQYILTPIKGSAIEKLTNWNFGYGGFKLGYKSDVKGVLSKVEDIISNPIYGYQTIDKLNECILFLGEVEKAILLHNGGVNCNVEEKKESLRCVQLEINRIEGFKKNLGIEAKLYNPTPMAKTKGFDSKLSAEQIEKLYNQMQGVYFETTLENFGNIFKNSLLVNFTPIKTKPKFTNVLLAYFINHLFQRENPNFWSIGEYCFGKKNLCQSLTNAYKTNKNRNPRGCDALNEIFKNAEISN